MYGGGEHEIANIEERDTRTEAIAEVITGRARTNRMWMSCSHTTLMMYYANDPRFRQNTEFVTRISPGMYTIEGMPRHGWMNDQ